MGTYTEIHCYGEVKKGTPEHAVLLWLVCDSDMPKLPDHQFFSSERHRYITHSCSYYHSPVTLRGWESAIAGDTYDFFHFVGNIKNYDEEIEKFCDWLKKSGVKFRATVTEETGTVTVYTSKEY